MALSRFVTVVHRVGMAQRSLEALTTQECFALLATKKVGRFVYVDDLGPLAQPVNFSVAENRLVIRVEHGTKELAVNQPTLALEVDHIDEEARAAWSVLVRGPVREVGYDELPALLRQMPDGPPQPWADGIHNVWLEVTPDHVTGKRLGRMAAPLVM